MKNLPLLLLAGVLVLVPVRVSGMIPRGGGAEKGRDEEHGDKKPDPTKATEARTEEKQIATAQKAALQGPGNSDLGNNSEVVEEESYVVSEENVDFKLNLFEQSAWDRLQPAAEVASAAFNELLELPRDEEGNILESSKQEKEKLRPKILQALKEYEDQRQAWIAQATSQRLAEVETLEKATKPITFEIVKDFDVTTEENGAVFWTGYTLENQRTAMAYAAEQGKKTIEMTRDGKLLDQLGMYKEGSPIATPIVNEKNEFVFNEEGEKKCKSKLGDLLFDAVSTKFAQSAFGKVTAVIYKPRTLDEQAAYQRSAYARIEEPILLAREQAGEPVELGKGRVEVPVDITLPALKTLIKENAELKKDYALVLGDFQKAFQDYPTAERFCIVKNKIEKLASLQPVSQKGTNQKRSASENQEIFKELKRLFKEKYPHEEVEKIFPQEKEKYAALSSKKLQKIFSDFESVIPKISNGKRVSFEKHQELLIASFHASLQKARETTAELSKLHDQQKNDHENWYLDSIDIFQINSANYRAVEAKLAEIAKVALVRIHQCKKEKVNLKGVLNPDLSVLAQFCSGYHPVEEMIRKANSIHEEWDNLLKTDGANRNEAQIKTQGHWEEILKEVKKIQELFNKRGFLQELQEQLQLFQKTYGYFQKRREGLQIAFSKQQELADQHWKKVFVKTKELLSIFSRSEEMPIAKENSENLTPGISHNALEAKHSFEEADRIAASCLEDANIYFFQEEQQRSSALKEMRHTWKKKIERCAEEYQKLLDDQEVLQSLFITGKKLQNQWQQIPHFAQNFILPFIENEEIVFKTEEEIARTEQKLKKKEEELSALRRSVEATEMMEQAERILTESTKIEWEPSESLPKNNWANDTLSDAFIATRSQAHKAHKQALQCEEELFNQVRELQQKYYQFDQLFCSSLVPSIEEMRRFEKSLNQAWIKTNQETTKSRKAWNKAREAILTAKENKVSWARNLLRLAGSASEDFSLGEATKRDADLLGKLWVGPNATPWSKNQNRLLFPMTTQKILTLKRKRLMDS